MEKQVIGVLTVVFLVLGLHFAFTREIEVKDELLEELKLMHSKCINGNSNAYYDCDDINNAIKKRVKD